MEEAIQASARIRTDAKRRSATLEEVHDAVSIVGGRLSFLSKVSKARDVVEMARHMRSTEKAWLLSVIGLIPDCDDDVMDEVCSLSVLLLADEVLTVGICLLSIAKMELVFLVVAEGVCEAETRTGAPKS